MDRGPSIPDCGRQSQPVHGARHVDVGDDELDAPNLLQNSDEHVARLEKVFEELDESPRGKTCDAIMGIIEEGQEVMKEFKGAPALDAGLLAAAQAVEHYEIARYGTLKTWAQELGLNQSVKLLETTLAEEKKTDETLTKLAESSVNQHAQAA